MTRAFQSSELDEFFEKCERVYDKKHYRTDFVDFYLESGEDPQKFKKISLYLVGRVYNFQAIGLRQISTENLEH